MVTDDNRYPGGKGLIHKWLIGMMPTHSVYIEPFVGKGAVMRNKPAALQSILIDRNPEVIAWWREMRWPGSAVKRDDGILWLKRHARKLGPDTLVYCDPPYLWSTRVRLDQYGQFELTPEQHAQLLEVLTLLECHVMLSGYPSTMYEDALVGWHREETQAITRGGTMRTEVCWMNFDPTAVSPALATQYSALGGTFRERERVARKIGRWVNRIKAMPTREREAILLSLIDARGNG